MRIVLVNWAPIWDGAAAGGGVNGYCQSLAVELVRLGHDVVSLFGGVRNDGGACRVERHADWLGVRVFEVVNSPVLAPSMAQFRDPDGEVESPELERHVGELFSMIRPDVVHWHNVEGFSIGCVDAARRCGARVVYSLHNYHTLCPQVYFMQGHTRPCFDSRGGEACEGCIETPEPSEERARRERMLRGEPEPQAPPEPAPEVPVPIPVGGEGDCTTPKPCDGDDARGDTQTLLGEIEGRAFLTIGGEGWETLTNEVAPEPEARELNRYGRRRAAMVGMLNRCDRVLAVSSFVERKFVSMGVRPDVIETQHIGTRVTRTRDWLRDLVFDPPPFEPARPVRLVFIGSASFYKGLHVLADALELLTPEILRRIDLAVHASGGEGFAWRLQRLESRLAKLTLGYGYRPTDIPWVLGGKDLGVVPSVWWDNGPQTVFEMLGCGVPVLGAEIGGIPDFVEEGVNGMLFRANDRFDLARRIGEVVRGPEILTRLRAGVRDPKGIGVHAEELVRIYDKRGGPVRR